MQRAAQAVVNADLFEAEQAYSADPLADRETDLYRGEYVMTFVEKWDELIDWSARAAGEGQFFIDVLRARGKNSVLDVATGTGFHSVRLREAGFDVTSADGSAAMLAKAFENGQRRGLILKTVQADWRWLNRDIHGKYDAIICLGNSFSHLHAEQDRRRALAEFYAALKHDGVLILDQRNYDMILDNGFSTKHKYYYCGDKVVAEPEYVDDTLARFKYSFADGAEYTLNLCPIRRAYMRRLLLEAGFERVRTYGDFQEAAPEDAPDFFIHVAEKSRLHAPWAPTATERADARDVAETYYDSDDADAFYSTVWGGEDLHVGLHEDGRDIRQASDATVDLMAEMLPGLDETTRLLDLGAGYGGSMRRLAQRYGCAACCLNISETQNDANRARTRAARLSDRIAVIHASFDDIPLRDASQDAVWSQDAFLHAPDRAKVLAEAWRVLRPGGHLIFTDPMQADDADPEALRPVYDRLQLDSLGSFRFYRETAERLGFELVEQRDMSERIGAHYARIRAEMLARRDALTAQGASEAYLDRMAEGLSHWVYAAEAGRLAWGVQLFRKPG